MLISFVTTAYNASRTIVHTLDSIFSERLPDDWQVESIVVDDGSEDGADLEKISRAYPEVFLVKHDVNKGMCAGKNSGIMHSSGDIVIILDADDTLVAGWARILGQIMTEWPDDSQVCFAVCRTLNGEITASDPAYDGYHTLDDQLNERHSGEYLPIFRGKYIRKNLYFDFGGRRDYPVYTYIRHLQDSPIWISSQVLRIYEPGASTQSWISPEKAANTARFYMVLFEHYGDLYRQKAPRIYRTKQLRHAIYLRWGGIPGAWNAFRKGCSFMTLPESIGAFMLLILPSSLSGVMAVFLKKINFIRRYG